MCCIGGCFSCLASLSSLLGLSVLPLLFIGCQKGEQEQFPIIPVDRIPSYYRDPTNPYLIYLFY